MYYKEVIKAWVEKNMALEKNVWGNKACFSDNFCAAFVLAVSYQQL